ncbi:hypothetical protein [Paraburkholderia sp. BR14374]|uniref:hypothetical protein n=1 Tax=Paraburkholderia sp. BR14374 TaxID=3237007 RepID=UPI0034CE65B1
MLAGQGISLSNSPLAPLRIADGFDGNDEAPHQNSDFVLLGISSAVARGDDSLLSFHDFTQREASCNRLLLPSLYQRLGQLGAA